MSLISEIHKKSGVLLRAVPSDSRLREFKSGRNNWYAVSMGYIAVFGPRNSDHAFIWTAASSGKIEAVEKVSIPAEKRSLSAKELKQEREIVSVGNAMQDSGEQMAEADLDRYIVALTRIIESQGGPLKW